MWCFNSSLEPAGSHRLWLHHRPLATSVCVCRLSAARRRCIFTCSWRKVRASLRSRGKIILSSLCSSAESPSVLGHHTVKWVIQDYLITKYCTLCWNDSLCDYPPYTHTHRNSIMNYRIVAMELSKKNCLLSWNQELFKRALAFREHSIRKASLPV